MSADPIAQFETVFEIAKEKSQSDATAMVLSTCGQDGQPSSRVVLLKDFSPEGFTFYTNYQSRKSRDLSKNSRVSLCFYWPEIGQQVRIEGHVEKVSPETSDEYFSTRPRLSQLGAWASEQSQPLDSRQVLLDRLKSLEDKYKNQQVPRPPHWGGFLVRPHLIEFWINAEFRLHDRFVYTRDTHNATWSITRLNP